MLPLSGVAVLWVVSGVACLGAQDEGGQEGEERGTRGDYGSSGSTEADPEEGDTGDPVFDPESIYGQRVHRRGVGSAGAYDCELYWTLDGHRTDDWCSDCAYAFDLQYTLDTELSTRSDVYTCGDAYFDAEATIGILLDYAGYGPMVVGRDPYSGEPYLLGGAEVDGDEISWTYGYSDEMWGDASSSYYTWYWRVDAVFE
jgi:hypothetical protein